MSELRAVLDAAISEREWQAQVEEYARLRGWLTYHTRDSRGSTEGFPDLVMVRRGVIVVAELKTEKGQPSIEQYQWLYELAGVGFTFGGVYLWRPSDWPEVERVMA